MHIEIVPLTVGLVVGHLVYRFVRPIVAAKFAVRGLRAKIAKQSAYFGPKPQKCFGLPPHLTLAATRKGVRFTLRNNAGDFFEVASGTVTNSAAGVYDIDFAVAANNARQIADANRAHPCCRVCQTA